MSDTEYEDPQQAIREAKQEEAESRARVKADPRYQREKDVERRRHRRDHGAERISGLPPVPKQRLKGWAMTVATQWLLERDFQVFKNVCDGEKEKLVGVNDGDYSLFDVKVCSIYRGPSGKLRVNGAEKYIQDIEVKTGINLIYVTGDGICALRPSELVATYELLAQSAPAEAN